MFVILQNLQLTFVGSLAFCGPNKWVNKFASELGSESLLIIS